VTHFLYLVRHGQADPHDGPLSPFARPRAGQDDTYELVVTHNLLIGWLVSRALDAPPWRWMGVNQMNCAVSIIGYLSGSPAALISFNDAGHLPPHLRWTGFPAALKPASG
jgi:probable phosphoglycerate mutase